MEMISMRNLRAQTEFHNSSPLCWRTSLSPANSLFSFPFCPCRSRYTQRNCCIALAKKRNSQLEPVIRRSATVEEEEKDYDDDVVDEFENGTFLDDDYFEDDFELGDAELSVGDGGGGGGILLAGTWWDRKALALAEEVSMSFNGDLKIYAFKTSASSRIQVRIEKLSNKYGSPSLSDIEIFSSAYQARLNEAELAGAIPEDISLEVSSPGVERLVRVPQELDRFKDLPMYVTYVSKVAETGSSQENDGVFKLVSFDLDSRHCTWSVADVRINREQAGKGRPLSKKQREWRLQLRFDSLRLVRLYSEF